MNLDGLAARDTILAALTGVVMPRLAFRLLVATNDGTADDWRLLGRIFGRVERRLKTRINRINNDQELQDVAVNHLSAEILESYIKSSYVFAKYHRIEPRVSYQKAQSGPVRQIRLQPRKAKPEDADQAPQSLEQLLSEIFGAFDDNEKLSDELEND